MERYPEGLLALGGEATWVDEDKWIIYGSQWYLKRLSTGGRRLMLMLSHEGEWEVTSGLLWEAGKSIPPSDPIYLYSLAPGPKRSANGIHYLE